MDLSTPRRLAEEAIECDRSGLGDMLSAPDHDDANCLVRMRFTFKPAPWIYSARSREPRLARLLLAALDVVSAADRIDTMKKLDPETHEPTAEFALAVVTLGPVLSAFRAAAQEETGK